MRIHTRNPQRTVVPWAAPDQPTCRPTTIARPSALLACGGPDTVANLQWQIVEGPRAKDKWERKGCGR